MKKTSILLFVLLFANGLFAQTTDSIKTSFDTLSAAYERFFEELNAIQERQTIREICGIPFGTSYEEARQRLYNKYGEPEYYPDRSVISFKNKVYAGITFDAIHFLFQSDGTRSYMNGCVFILNANTLKQAEKNRERLYEKLSKKYNMLNDVDENGNKYYYGGYGPTPNTIGFTIDILKYEKDLARQFNPYATRLAYGRYNYIIEEF